MFQVQNLKALIALKMKITSEILISCSAVIWPYAKNYFKKIYIPEKYIHNRI